MGSISRKLFSRMVCVLIIGSPAVGIRAQVPKPTESSSASKLPGTPTPPQTHEMTASDIAAFLDGILPMQLQREDIAGAVVVIVKNGSILFAQGYGYADVKARRKVSPTVTLFRPGSISKTFTWTAVMQLVEQGKIDLDADVSQYLDFQIPHSSGRPVTMRNLMTHTAGFEESTKDVVVDRPDELTALPGYVTAHRPNQIFTPGTVPAYSNYGADLAGYIVQRVSGLPFEEYVQKNIFQPLGISHGTFLEPLPDSFKADLSNGYELASQDAKPFEWIPPNPAPDGSLSITGAEMASFMIAHLQDGRYRDARILQPQTAQMMHARQFSMDPAANGMALGFYEENRNGLRIIGHGGDLNYFHSDMHLVPSEGLGFFVSYNSLGKAELDVRTALWDAFLNRYFPAGQNNAPTGPPTDAEAVSGKYLSSRRAETTILRSLWFLTESSVTKKEDGTIEVDSMKDFSGQPKRWRSVGNLQFRELDGQQLLIFKQDPTGRLAMITEDPTDISQRVAWTENKTVLLLALGFAALVFSLALVFWPIGAILRRHYQRTLTLSRPQMRMRVFVKLGCAAQVLALIAFAGTVAYGFSNLSFFSDRYDWWLRCVQLLFTIGLAAAVIVSYGSYSAWKSSGKKVWPAACAAGLIVASFIYVWFAVTSGVLQVSLKY